jgi:hypothetical protein
MIYLWCAVLILLFAGYLAPALALSGLGIYLGRSRL